MKLSDLEVYQLATHRPRDRKELDTYCKAIFNMDIPKDRSGYCKRHCRQCDPPFEALASAYFAETPEAGWVGGRGTSKTVMIALLSSIELLTLGVDISIISGSKDQAGLILKYMRNQDATLAGKLWGAENAPRWMFNEREDAKFRLRTVEDKSDKKSIGNEIIAHAAAESSIRGAHPVRLRIDECLCFDTNIDTTCGTKRVCDLQPEDAVYGWDGTKVVSSPVLRVWCTGVKPTIRFDFEDGSHIEVTGNHPIMTDSGWQYAENIAKTATRLLQLRGGVSPIQQTEGDKPMSAVLEPGEGQKYDKVLRLWEAHQAWEVESWQCAVTMCGVLSQDCGETQENLPDLWSRCDLLCNTVSRLLRSEKGSQGETLCRLWAAVAWENKSVQTVFPGVHAVRRVSEPPRPGNCGEDTGRSQSPDAQPCGGRLDRNTGCFENQVHTSASIQSIHSGFLSASVEHGHRSRIAVTVHSEECRNFDTQSEVATQKRSASVSAYDNQEEPLVVGSPVVGDSSVRYKRIIGVSDGRVAPVYDVALEHTHNFFANGILVHNCDLADWEHLDTAKGLPTEDIRKPEIPTHMLYASTYHKYEGSMAKMIRLLRSKGFPVFSWCVFEQLEENGGFLTRRYIADKMRAMGKIKWDIEYMNNGPIQGIPVLDADMLASRFRPDIDSVAGLPNVLWCLTDTPSKITRHYHGIDWAKAEHWSIFDTLTRVSDGYQQAAWYRTGRKPWPEISRDAARHIQMFPGTVAHDATGVGAAMDDWLVEHRIPRSRIMGINWRKTTLIKEMATAYVGALQSGEIYGPDIEFARSEHEYLTEAMLYDDEHCPDSVAAALMAYWVARQNNRGGRSPRPMRIPTR